MQVFKAFIRIAKSRLSSITLYLIVCLVLLIALSFLGNESFTTAFESSSLDICIIDEDSSTASSSFCEYLGSIHNLVTLENTDDETLADSLYYSKIKYVLTIPKGFEEHLLRGETENILKNSKLPNNAGGYFLDQQINQYITGINLYLKGGFTLEESIDNMILSMENTPEVNIIKFESDGTSLSSSSLGFYQFLPYFLLILLIYGMAPILAIFRQKDLENRIQCSCLSLGSKNFQICLGCVAYSLIIFGLLLLASCIFFGPATIFSKDGILCIINSVAFWLVSIAITLFVSVFSPNGDSLNLISNIISLGMSFLCGIFVPQYILGESVLQFSRFLPAYWYIRIIDMLNGQSKAPFSMEVYRTCIGIQLLFFLAIFTLYLVAGKLQQGSKKE